MEANEANAYQILVCNIKYGTKVHNGAAKKIAQADLPDQITLDVPITVLQQANKNKENFNDIIEQAEALGTYVFLYSGGEPLVRKKDIITLCERHPEAFFTSFTNGTLIDEDFCKEIARVKNFVPAISVEGFEEDTDFRRGKGTFAATQRAMELLRKYKLLFGISCCYTRKNAEFIGSEEYIDAMINWGAKFCWLFTYMPIGKDAVPELMATAEQRKYMYQWIRSVRNQKTGKPIFVMDFQDDGEYVGGCIAGGRNYFHINSAGDIEPCVFVHYSDSNIRTHKLLEALQRPLFMEYYRNQPFNDNHLRPCPMLENPDCLCRMIEKTGAKSTDLIDQESAEELCAKCRDFAAKWQPVADELWNSTPHRETKTYYYRDTPEGKAAKAAEKND